MSNMSKLKREQKSERVAVRLSSPLLLAIDRYAARIGEDRSTACRRLLRAALDGYSEKE